MSKITLQKLQDAEAFLNKHIDQHMNAGFNHVTCTIYTPINSLEDLDSYDEKDLVQLINAKVHLNFCSDVLNEYKKILKAEKEESNA